MKDNSVLSQFTSRLPTAPPQGVSGPLPAEEPVQEENLGAFGILRGIRDKSLMLELRRRDGTVKALSYSLLEEIDFDASIGITLKFATRTVKIVGRNLNAEITPNIRLLDGLCRHRVSWIQEATERSAFQADRDATIVECLEFE